MKCKNLLATALLILLPAMTWAADVYFYNAANAKVASATKVQRIEFTSTGVNVVTTDGKTIPVSASNFDYVLFREKTTTGISSIKASSDEGIVFSISSDAVSLASSEQFSSVELFDEGGRKVAKGKVDGTRASLSLASIGNGIYVVKAVAGGKTAVKKIVKK